MNSAVRFVAVDLDGTVVVEGAGVSPRTIAAFSALKARGIVPLIATGRPRRSTLPWAAILGVEAGLVCHNGAAVYDGGGRLIAETTLAEPTSRTLIGLARGMPLHFHGFVGDEWLYEAVWPGTARYERRSGFPGRQVSFDEIPRLGFNKAMFISTEEEVAPTTSRIRGVLGSSLEIYASGTGFVECVAPGIGKGKGLAALVASLGGRMDEVLAFGDAGNDEDMLLAAGIGVAMGNAPEALKARVGRVAPPATEDGVALWLQEELGIPS